MRIFRDESSLSANPPVVVDHRRAGHLCLDTGEVRDLAWDRQGLWVVDEESATRSAINTDQLAATACALAGRDLTRDEWTRFVGDLPYEPTCAQDPSTE